jgi:hypothetical protein
VNSRRRGQPANSQIFSSSHLLTLSLSHPLTLSLSHLLTFPHSRFCLSTPSRLRRDSARGPVGPQNKDTAGRVKGRPAVFFLKTDRHRSPSEVRPKGEPGRGVFPFKPHRSKYHFVFARPGGPSVNSHRRGQPANSQIFSSSHLLTLSLSHPLTLSLSHPLILKFSYFPTFPHPRFLPLDCISPAARFCSRTGRAAKNGHCGARQRTPRSVFS